jgi:hypothetical protein
MDDDAPVIGDFPEPTRLPLITLPEAREAVRLLQVLAGGDTEHATDAHILAGQLAGRLPSE